jgi:hypothetical protein
LEELWSVSNWSAVPQASSAKITDPFSALPNTAKNELQWEEWDPDKKPEDDEEDGDMPDC